MITERCPPPDWDELGEPEAGDAGEVKRRGHTAHETSRVALAERVDYLMIAAAEVRDTQLTPHDAKRLRRLCDDLELSEAETQRVLAAAAPAAVEEPAPTRKEGSNFRR